MTTYAKTSNKTSCLSDKPLFGTTNYLNFEMPSKLNKDG